MATSNQSAAVRPISFVYHNIASGGAPEEMGLTIRPEELVRTDTSRLTVHHTLGGAFADNFGEGIPSVQISGHTGWGQGSNKNGLDYFIKLHQFVYKQWHKDRAIAAANGVSPDQVKLIFCDLLDEFTWSVVPVSFVLKRNKANPLLLYYQINLTRMDDAINPVVALSFPVGGNISLAVDSFDAALNRIDSFTGALATSINDFFGPINSVIGDAIQVSAKINHTVFSVIKAGNSVDANLLGIASGLTLASSNILSSIAAVEGIPQSLKADSMLVKASFLNLFCLLQNSFRPQQQLPRYDIYGSSLCSSTAGGSPLLPYQNSNTLENVFHVYGQPLTVTPQAIDGISRMTKLDTALTDPNLDYLRTASADITQGIRNA